MPFGVDLPDFAAAKSESHSDTRTVTLTLATGDYKFVDVGACGSNLAKRTYFGAGETVYLYLIYRNSGLAAGAPLIVIKDVDTGSEVKRIGLASLNPGEQNGPLTPPPTIGTMPNKTWNLQLTLTP